MERRLYLSLPRPPGRRGVGMTVEAATVVFGRYVGTDGRDGRACLQDWVKKYCLDYRLRNHNGVFTVDMLFYKPVDRYWLTNRPSIYAGRWAFERSTYDRENTKPMTKAEYLQGSTPVVSAKAAELLQKTYKRSAEKTVAREAYRALGTGKPLQNPVYLRPSSAEPPRKTLKFYIR